MKKILSTLTFVAIATTAIFAQGFYLEMKMSSSAAGAGFAGDIKIYYQDGNSRSEIVMTGVPVVGTMNIVSLSLADKPGTAYILNEKDKTYSEISSESDEDLKDYPQSDYEVTVIGKEKVNGYNATHVKVKRKGSQTEDEWWTSTEIVDYASYNKIKSKYTGKDNFNKALAAKGADGFPVRIKTKEEGFDVQLDLVKAEKKTTPASSFKLDGYTKSTGANIGGINTEELMQKMMQMSPEEREKYMKQLEQMYKQE